MSIHISRLTQCQRNQFAHIYYRFQWDFIGSLSPLSGFLSYFKIVFLPSFPLFDFWLCCVACMILVPWPEIKPTSSALEAWSLNHWTDRKVLKYFFNLLIISICIFLFGMSLSSFCWKFTTRFILQTSLCEWGIIIVANSCCYFED